MNTRSSTVLSPELDIDPAYRRRLRARAEALADACIHAGEAPDPATGALDPPLVLASAFAFESAEEAAGAFRGDNDARIYGRWGNPSVDALEAKVCALEEAEAACAAASGMAAITGTLMTLCDQGAHVIAPRSMYGESARLLRERLPRFGIATTFVDAPQPGAYEAALRPETRVLYVETPSNPMLRVTDLRAVVELARRHGLAVVVDSTFATPFGQTPLSLGADFVVHSMTKAMSGHGDAIGGVVCGRRAGVEKVKDLIVKGLGGVLSPFSAYLVARGLRTFAIRQERACETAAYLALRLAAHPAVEKVHHPSLTFHVDHERAVAQMHAFGSVLSFEVKGRGGLGPLERGREVLGRAKLMTHAVSLGDMRTLIVHPASTTHSTMPPDVRRGADITDGLLRLSVGLESAVSLWDDLDQALA